MPKGGHKIVRGTRRQIGEFGAFLARHDPANFPSGLLCPPGSQSHCDAVARRAELRESTLGLLAARLLRGYSSLSDDLILTADPERVVKLELPIPMIEYIGNFKPNLHRSGLFGKNASFHQASPSNPSALQFVNICARQMLVRRGRPRVTYDERYGRVGERQEFRLLKRDREYKQFVSAGGGLFGRFLKPTE